MGRAGKGSGCRVSDQGFRVVLRCGRVKGLGMGCRVKGVGSRV